MLKIPHYVLAILLSACNWIAPEYNEPEPIRAFDITFFSEFNNQPVYGVSILPEGFAIGGKEGIWVKNGNHLAIESGHITKASTLFQRSGTTTYANAGGLRVISRLQNNTTWKIVAESSEPFGAYTVLPSGRVIIGILGGVKYKDSGSPHWVNYPINIPNGIEPIRINMFLQAKNGTVFAGTHNGVYRSEDDGESWMKVTNSIHKDVDDFLLYEELDGTILAIYGRTHYASSDNGETWTPRTYDRYGGLIYRDGDREYSNIGNDIRYRNVGEVEFIKTDIIDHIRYIVNKPLSISYIDVRENQLLIHLSTYQVIIATPNPKWEGWGN